MTSPHQSRPTDGVRSVVRKAALLVAGGLLTLVGLVLLVVPGPGIPLVIAGLAILSPESPWARRQRDRLRDAGRTLLNFGRAERDNSPPDQADA